MNQDKQTPFESYYVDSLADPKIGTVVITKNVDSYEVIFTYAIDIKSRKALDKVILSQDDYDALKLDINRLSCVSLEDAFSFQVVLENFLAFIDEFTEEELNNLGADYKYGQMIYGSDLY